MPMLTMENTQGLVNDTQNRKVCLATLQCRERQKAAAVTFGPRDGALIARLCLPMRAEHSCPRERLPVKENEQLNPSLQQMLEGVLPFATGGGRQQKTDVHINVGATCFVREVSRFLTKHVRVGPYLRIQRRGSIPPPLPPSSSSATRGAPSRAPSPSGAISPPARPAPPVPVPLPPRPVLSGCDVPAERAVCVAVADVVPHAPGAEFEAARRVARMRAAGGAVLAPCVMC